MDAQRHLPPRCQHFARIDARHDGLQYVDAGPLRASMRLAIASKSGPTSQNAARTAREFRLANGHGRRDGSNL
jgi:hypothetical protein